MNIITNIKKKIVQNLGTSIFVFFMVIALIITKWNQHSHQNKIENSHIFINGYATSFEKAGYRQSDYYKFRYIFKAKNYNVSDLAKMYVNDFEKYFVSKPFPVILNQKYPEDGQMLIFSSDFEKYGYKQPDSLKWVNKYER